MSLEENKALVRRFLEGNATTDEVMAPGVVWHGPTPFGTVKGLENLKAAVGARMFAAFPDLQTTVHDLIAEGDRVTARWTDTGTHRADFFGISPTETSVEYQGLSIYRVEGGKIAEGWVQWDVVGLLQQLGQLENFV